MNYKNCKGILDIYGLSGFRIVEYDNKGYCKEREDLKSDFFTRGLVLHVQENYNGHGLSVGPIGYYQNRVIRLEVYYVDDDGSKHPSTIKPQVLGEV